MALAEAFASLFLAEEPKRRERAKPSDNSSWTEHVTGTASGNLEQWGLFVTSKFRKDTSGRSEYLNLDVLYPLQGPRLAVGRAPMQLGGHDQLGGVGNTG